MATIVSVTPTGFNVTGLTRPWDDCDLAPLAREIGALCVAWGDIMQQSLVVVCDTEPTPRDTVLMHLLNNLKAKNLYSRRQEVSFITLDTGLTLVRFEDGLPDGDHIAYRAAHTAIDEIVYGNRHMVLVRANAVSDKAWGEGLNAVWQRLRMNGVPKNDQSGLPLLPRLPWTRHRTTGQIVMVDPGLAVIEIYQPVQPTFNRTGYQHEAMPVVIGGRHNFILAAGDSWPDEERTILSGAGVCFHIEVGRTANALAAIGYLDFDAPVVTL